MVFDPTQLALSSFHWRESQIFNALPPKIRNLSNCDVLLFKLQMDNYLTPLPDVPCTPNTDNSITGTGTGTGLLLYKCLPGNDGTISLTSN